MKHIKSERLKKLESEINDLEQWLKLGLVPSKDVVKHKHEIQAIKDKINEEKERLKFLKESGEMEEYSTPKRNTGRSTYTEMPSLPDIDIGETAGHITEGGFDMSTENGEAESSIIEEREEEEEGDTEGGTRDETESSEKDDLEDEESYFSDHNRWKRGSHIIDPDENKW